jgi:tRNA pseudouridine38-40 synthase
MQAAANMLVGPHDFTTFRSVHCQAHSPVKTLDVLEIERAGDEVLVRARARSFLHNQVRAMVGTLKRVGEGRMSVAEVAAALAARDRSAAGPTAPACGLYLAAVDYGDEAAPGRV